MTKRKAKLKEPLFDFVNPRAEYLVENGEALDTLKKFPDGRFDLVITSPPASAQAQEWTWWLTNVALVLPNPGVHA